MTCSADQSGLLALIGLPVGGGEYGHNQLLGIRSDLKYCSLRVHINITAFC